MSDERTPTFPQGSKIHEELRLVTWHPRGILDARLAYQVLSFVEAEEATAEHPFNRFADLSGLESIRLSFVEMEEIAARRVESYRGQPVKSAVRTTNPVAFGIARMYGQLLRPSPIEVRVFSHLDRAASWLNVPVAALEPPANGG